MRIHASVICVLSVAHFFAASGTASTIVNCGNGDENATSCGGASVSITGPLNFSVQANPSFGPVTYSAEVTQDISFTFLDNAAMTGYYSYSPCFTLISNDLGEESASLGSLKFEHGGTGNVFSCKTPIPPYNDGFILPFTFGQVQTEQLSLEADAYYAGQAYAAFSGFILLDQFGNILPAGTWSVEAVPEPSEIPAFGATVALGLLGLVRRRV